MSTGERTRRGTFSRVVGHLTVVLAMLVIVAPLAVVVYSSFSQSRYDIFAFSGFTLDWWGSALTAEWLEPIVFSLQLGILAALISTVLGTFAAFGTIRGEFRGRETLAVFFLGPL